MADSTVTDLGKMKVIDLRKELKSRGLPAAGDKTILISRLQEAMSQDEHGDINLDSDEIDSDGVLEDEDDKSQTDILDDTHAESLNEELALADQPPPEVKVPETKTPRTLKRKFTSDSSKTIDTKTTDKDATSKKIILNRATSVIATTKTEEEKNSEESIEDKSETTIPSNKVKITADLDSKTKLELRAKRFGLPVKMSDTDKKEARKQRFNQNTNSEKITTSSSGTLSENLDKLKKRAERFGQSVSKIMTDIESKEKLEKRKAKFGATA